MFKPKTISTDLQIARSNTGSGEKENYPRELAPSLEACAELQYAYAYFNDRLWDGALPPCMIVYTRKKNCLGYFAPDRFRRIDGTLAPELALHPGYLAVRDDRDSLSTLVHEGAHVWRHHFGPRSRNGNRVTSGYHDRHWANEMLRIGLVPTATGAPGGKMTGYRMTHYIEVDGLFDRVCAELLATGFRINWADRIVRPKPITDDPKIPEDQGDLDEQPQKKDRVKFTCQGCGLNAWAKPSAKLDCGTCKTAMKPVLVTP